jgi:hypothetical protein
MKKKKKLSCNITLTEDDLSLVNVEHYGMTSFAIEKLNVNNFDDDLAANLESFFMDEMQINADLFNVEYMGFLTGQVRIESSKIKSIIPIINEFLKTNF